MRYLSIFGPKHTTGPPDVLQGSYPRVPSLRYLSVSLRTSPPCVTSVFPAKAPGAACALRYSSCLSLCSQGSAAPTSALPPPTSALPPPWCHPHLSAAHPGPVRLLSAPFAPCPGVTLGPAAITRVLPNGQPVPQSHFCVSCPGPQRLVHTRGYRGSSPTQCAPSWLPPAENSQLDLGSRGHLQKQTSS